MRAVLLVLCLVALLFAGCGASATPDPPRAGILGAQGDGPAGAPASPRRIRRPFDPVPALLRCLREHQVRSARRANEVVLIGPASQGLRIRFLATGGVTETAQLEGRAEGAEVIGRALLYPGSAPDKILKRVEDCTGDAGLKE